MIEGVGCGIKGKTYPRGTERHGYRTKEKTVGREAGGVSDPSERERERGGEGGGGGGGGEPMTNGRHVQTYEFLT